MRVLNQQEGNEMQNTNSHVLRLFIIAKTFLITFHRISGFKTTILKKIINEIFSKEIFN